LWRVSEFITTNNAAIAQGWAGIAQAFFALVLVLIGAFQVAIYFRTNKILWRQTKLMARQARVAVKQATIADKQAAIAERQLLMQGPFLRYDVYSLSINLDRIENKTLEGYRIHLIWKNSDRDIATNVTYYIGHSLEIPIADVEALRKSVNEFGQVIFKMKGLEGKITLAPEAAVETDQIVLSPTELGRLYRKEIRLLVWCVIGYGSRLQPIDWFAETAIWLEFVLDHDPETYRPSSTASRPFRVAVVGYRYREDRDQKSNERL
jgi:hypothetical protein